MDLMQTLLISTIPAIITGLLSYILSSIQREKSKADLMVIRSAKHFLEHKGFTDRSFNSLKKYLGGWDNDEDGLRRILVSAGAVRIYRKDDDNNEWWYLLSRDAERIAKLNSSSKKR